MQILTTLTDSMTAQLNSIHLGILKLISLTFMLETTYIQKKLKLHTYTFWGVKRVFYWLVNDDSDKCPTKKSRLDQYKGVIPNTRH
jgi:hypothetical protein